MKKNKEEIFIHPHQPMPFMSKYISVHRFKYVANERCSLYNNHSVESFSLQLRKPPHSSRIPDAYFSNKYY